MTDIEQRAHDIALAVTSQILASKHSAILKTSNSEEITLPIELREVIDGYCAAYDAICDELAKRMG